MKPQRIQRKRTKGWRMPEGAVYVGRPSKWGNPYTIAGRGSHGKAVRAFRTMTARTTGVRTGWERGAFLTYPSDADQPCHADVLLELANGGAS